MPLPFSTVILSLSPPPSHLTNIFKSHKKRLLWNMPLWDGDDILGCPILWPLSYLEQNFSNGILKTLMKGWMGIITEMRGPVKHLTVIFHCVKKHPQTWSKSVPRAGLRWALLEQASLESYLGLLMRWWTSRGWPVYSGYGWDSWVGEALLPCGSHSRVVYSGLFHMRVTDAKGSKKAWPNVHALFKSLFVSCLLPSCSPALVSLGGDYPRVWIWEVWTNWGPVLHRPVFYNMV